MGKKSKVITLVLVIILSALLLKNLFSGKAERSSTEFDEKYEKYLGNVELNLKPNTYTPKNTSDATNQYAELLEISKIYFRARQLCLKNMMDYHPINVVKHQKQTDYWGVRVGTDEWNEIIKAYDAYATEVCSAYSEKEMEEIFINELSSKFSIKEKDQLKSFYESEFGKKLIEATVSANYKMMETSYESQTVASKKYTEIYNAQVENIYQKTLDESPFGWFVKIINKIR